MQLTQNFTSRLALYVLICAWFIPIATSNAEDPSALPDRQTPIVRAVAGCRMSVVNLRGRKSIPVDEHDTSGETMKQVNGMGTGVVIDSRGYVLTNYHVVEGVKTIEVTTSDRQKTTATLIAHDPVTDLAVLKLAFSRSLPKIRIGTSSDLMLAEQVIAVGNAYGYEHTVTVGIISSLSRTVQVNDEQIYRNLIQTDAAINPGNSGGPLLNTAGEMIGINVAVRIGAQGIAFAIPVNDAIEVAADLLAKAAPQDFNYGLAVQTDYVDDRAQLKVVAVTPGGPADAQGIKVGDRLFRVNEQPVQCRLDFQAAVIESASSGMIELEVGDQNRHEVVAFSLERHVGNDAVVEASAIAWQPLGLKLVSATESELRNRHPNYKRGLRVIQVRPNSPAEAEGIIPGDVLVAMHGWKTETLENLAYILQRPDIVKQSSFMFYILRDKEPFWGQMRVASVPR